MDYKNYLKIVKPKKLIPYLKTIKDEIELHNLIEFIITTKQYKSLEFVINNFKNNNFTVIELIFNSPDPHIPSIIQTIIAKNHIDAFNIIYNHLSKNPTDISHIAIYKELYRSIKSNNSHIIKQLLLFLVKHNHNIFLQYVEPDTLYNIYHQIMDYSPKHFETFLFSLPRETQHFLNYYGNKRTPIHNLFSHNDPPIILEILKKLVNIPLIQWELLSQYKENYVLYFCHYNKHASDLLIHNQKDNKFLSEIIEIIKILSSLINPIILKYVDLIPKTQYYNQSVSKYMKKLKIQSNIEKNNIPVYNYNLKPIKRYKSKIKINIDDNINKYTYYRGDLPDELFGFSYINSKYKKSKLLTDKSLFNPVIANKQFTEKTLDEMLIFTDMPNITLNKEKIIEVLNTKQYIYPDICIIITPNSFILTIYKKLFNLLLDNIKNINSGKENITFIPLSICRLANNSLIKFIDKNPHNILNNDIYCHYNWVIYEKNNNNVRSYLYDPLGANSVPENNTNNCIKILHKLNSQITDITNVRIDTVLPYTILPQLNFQSFESYQKVSFDYSRRCDPDGFCMAWCFWMLDKYMEYIQKNEYIPFTTFNMELISLFSKLDLNLSELIRSYTKYMANYVNKIIKNKEYVEELSVREIKKIINTL